MSDAINPDHYNQGSIECIDAMKIILTPEEFRGYLKGNVFKYLWREKDKNGNEDLRKGKSYYDRLIELIDESEQQKASDLQSLKDHPFGKLKKPKWTPKIGDWVRIKKPADTQASATSWWPSMDKYDGQIIQVKQIEEDGVVLEEWGFMFDWLEPAEQPKATLNSDTIPEGYRKLNDSSIEPRQLGDLRWSVSEKRYIEISVDEIGYANRDNWAACRKVEPAIKQSLTPELPDGWRWLEVGEVIRKGDRYFDGNKWKDRDWAVKETYSLMHQKTIRRNRFEVGEEVVSVLDDSQFVVLDKHNKYNDVYVVRNGASGKIHNILDRLLAPYIEKAKPTVEVSVEVTGEAKNPIGCPDGWRFLEVGELIRKGDVWLQDGQIHSLGLLMIGQACQTHWKPIIRRNRFEVGEKVVRVSEPREIVFQVKCAFLDNSYGLATEGGLLDRLSGNSLASYIEESK